MNVQVTKDNVTILSKDNIHEGEYRINELSFDFSEEYTSNLVINAVFTNELGKAYQMSIIDNKCHIPAEILADTGQVVLGVYAYQINGEELELRYSPFPTSFVVLSGSYNPTAEESQEITPTQYEQYMQALQDGLNQVQASISELDNATKNANDLVDEINKKLENGDFIGPQGPIGPQGEPGKDGTNGIDGVGITTITSGQATEENGNTITPITVEKTDGSSETFNVSAKNGIDGKNGQNGKDGINGTNGIDGQDGITPNIQIGTVETLEPTEQATVTKTGTDEEPLLNFGIPKGEKGDPGEVTEDTLDNVIPKQTATDSIINVNDALKYKIFDFKVDGAYEQDGEPTPETPIPITTLTFDKITKNGQNLYNVRDAYTGGFNSYNSAYQVDEDDWVTLNIENEPSDIAYYNLFTNNLNLKPDTYYNVMVEVKQKSGLGTLSIVTNRKEDNVQVEGQFVDTFSETFGNLGPAIYVKKLKTLKKEQLDNTVAGLRSYIMLNKGAYSSITFRISVIEDTSVTPDTFTYQPYKETNYLIDLQGNEMVSLPNGVKDELQIDKKGTINLIKNIGKIIFNGTEQGWWLQENETNQYRIQLQGIKQWSSLLSNRFVENSNKEIGTMLAYSPNYIWFMAKETTLEDWQNYIENNPITVYYELAEPQTISLGKLSDLISTEQGSNTFAINSNIDTQISTTYALDLKKYIDNKIAQVSQAIVEGE